MERASHDSLGREYGCCSRPSSFGVGEAGPGSFAEVAGERVRGTSASSENWLSLRLDGPTALRLYGWNAEIVSWNGTFAPRIGSTSTYQVPAAGVARSIPS